MFLYKELKLLGAQDICIDKGTICVWGWGKVGLVEGGWWLGPVCWHRLVQRPACPWPDAAGSRCIPRVIYYPTGQASRSCECRCFSFPLSVLPGLTLFTVRFRMSVPQTCTDLNSLQGAFTLCLRNLTKISWTNEDGSCWSILLMRKLGLGWG